MWFDCVSSFIWKVRGFGGDCGMCCCSFCFGGWLLWLRLVVVVKVGVVSFVG